MKHWTLAGTTALATVLISGMAQAAVTPEDVWQNWQKLSASYGQAMVADSVARDGDTLVVSGMKISMDQDGAKMDGKMDEVRFRDLGDGTVEVTMSETYPITMTMPDGAGGSDVLDITISQPGLTLLADGSATETSYGFSGPTIGLAIAASKNGAKKADANVTLTNLEGSYAVSEENGATVVDTDMGVDSMAFTLATDDAGNSVNVSATLAALKFVSGGNFLGIAAMENMPQALKDGFATDGEFNYGKGDVTIDAVNAGKPTKIVASNESGHFKFALDADAMAYGAGGKGVAMTISGAEIPFPELKINYAEAAFDFLIPVSKSESPSDFSLLTKIVDLTVSDEIWGMIDPGASLPRDPATVIIDTKGTVTLKADLMDKAAMEATNGAPPADLNTLDITEVRAKIAGAELTGNGALTFDNTDLATFGGVPTPTGKIDLTLTGGNGLMDKLVAMGLIPEDQAMGARMMIAMFAKPTEGAPDTLTSTLEFKDKGFYANGQRLK
jgi:hypothetical protein